jgi:hypothetical protein
MCAAYHHRIGARPVEDHCCLCRLADIAIGDDRDRHRFLDAPDSAPVRLALVKRQRVRPCTVTIPTLACSARRASIGALSALCPAAAS